MTAQQLVVAAGALVGLGVALLLWRLVPAQPDVRDVLQRLARGDAADPGSTGVDAGEPGGDRRERLGRWGMKVLPPGVWGKVPTRELALLQVPLDRFYGEKLTLALCGLIFGPLCSLLLGAMGLHLPFSFPAAGSIALAALLWFLPNYNARDDAKRARSDFIRALSAYIDFVALERNAGSGPRQAMEHAAQIGDSWVFVRLREELARTRWSGVTPWQALRQLGLDLGLPDLGDLADILQLSGEEGTQIYANLRARVTSMRTAMLQAEKARANAVGERMYVPASLVGVGFMAILIAPMLLRVVAGT